MVINYCKYEKKPTQYSSSSKCMDLVVGSFREFLMIFMTVIDHSLNVTF